MLASDMLLTGSQATRLTWLQETMNTPWLQ